MDKLVTGLQWLLGVVFLLAGAAKLAQPREKIMKSGGKWAEDFSDPMIKLIGVGEVVCAIGVIVPHLFGMGEMLTALSAAGIAVFMAGAFAVHVKRKEPPLLVVTAVLFVLAAFVGYSRFTG